VANGCIHPPLCGPFAGVAIINRELGKGLENSPKWCKSPIVRQQQIKQAFKIMRSWHDRAYFLQQSL
jgi:hypothetical protein